MIDAPKFILSGTAACTELGDPEAFYPSGYTPDAVKAAKDICNRCVLKAKCLTYALEAPEKDGIWGGTTPGERERILRRQSRRAPNAPRSR